jgi:very-short-patch-repair endonuclease
MSERKVVNLSAEQNSAVGATRRVAGVNRKRTKASGGKKIKKKIPTKNEKRTKKDLSPRPGESPFQTAQRRATTYQRELIAKKTRSERKLEAILRAAKIEFKSQKIFYYGEHLENFYIADIYIPERKLIIEADGKIHERAFNVVWDERRNEYFVKERKLAVLRITNERILKMSKTELVSIIDGVSALAEIATTKIE